MSEILAGLSFAGLQSANWNEGKFPQLFRTSMKKISDLVDLRRFNRLLRLYGQTGQNCSLATGERNEEGAPETDAATDKLRPWFGNVCYSNSGAGG